MSRKRGLGRGLDALIPGDESFVAPGTPVVEVGTGDILPNPRQPRSSPQDSGLDELAESIAEHGVLQPLVVLPKDNQGNYVLIAGERRLEASKLAGLKTVPVIIRDTNEQGQLELALVENLQRSDLNALEAAEGFRQLIDDFNLSHEDVALKVGKSRTTVTNTLRLLKLSAPVRRALLEGKISEGHARALLPLPSAQAQSTALQAVRSRDLSVRETEALVRKLLGDEDRTKTSRPHTPEESDLENQLREALGTRVTIQKSRKGGRIVIHFYSDEELNTLLERFLDNPSA
jgi:ParB family chromosome partitioning protein